mmetsp:Transcript_15357/g.33103  ORF Transcript_15357/g.33103 Transcript_15357/m.33103 type:complete len:223 (+) Transcript_15357:228-896(+)
MNEFACRSSAVNSGSLHDWFVRSFVHSSACVVVVAVAVVVVYLLWSLVGGFVPQFEISCDSIPSSASSSRLKSWLKSSMSLSNSSAASTRASRAASTSLLVAAAWAFCAATTGEQAIRTNPWQPRQAHSSVSPRSMKGFPFTGRTREGRGMLWQRSLMGSFLRWITSSLRSAVKESRISSNMAASMPPPSSCSLRIPLAPPFIMYMLFRRWQSITAALDTMW